MKKKAIFLFLIFQFSICLMLLADENKQKDFEEAIRVGNIKLISDLLESSFNEIDINKKNRHGVTPLQISLRMGRNDIIKLLIEKKADLKQKDNNQDPPLIVALNNRVNIEIIEMLIEYGADVDDPNYEGNTPLMMAIRQNDLDLVELLLRKNANVNIKNQRRQSAILMASQFGSLDIVKMVIEKNANINDTDASGTTPLILAIQRYQHDVAKYLIEKNADVNARNDLGFTPLTASLFSTEQVIRKLLLEKGAKVNIADSYGNTPLMKVTELGDVQSVKLFIKYGADIEAINSSGKKAADFASDPQIKILFNKNRRIVDQILLKEKTQTEVSNPSCFFSIKTSLLDVMQTVWPIIRYRSKKIILRNRGCNGFLRNISKEKKYDGFLYLPSVQYLNKLESQDFVDHFLDLCKSGITNENFNHLFIKTINDPVYGPIISSYIKSLEGQENNLFKSKECQINFEYKKAKGPYILSDFPPHFGEREPHQKNDYPFIREESEADQDNLGYFLSYRNNTISSKKIDGLNEELASFRPYHDEFFDGKFLWRKTNLCPDGKEECDLEEKSFYVEPAPLCTSRGFPLEWEKKYCLKISVDPRIKNLGTLIENLSIYGKNEREVIFPAGSCFQYLGRDSSSPGVVAQHFQVVPWTDDPQYGLFSRKEAIFEASKYYGRKFPLENDSIKHHGMVVQRPNHGLTHGARSAYFALDLVKFFADNPDLGKFHHIAKEIIKNHDQKLDILFLMSLHFRAAREAETENFFSQYEEHMQKILERSFLVDDKNQIKKYANLLSQKPHLESDENKFMMLVLDISHRTDHLRQLFWDVKSSENEQRYEIGSKGQLDVEKQNKIINFMRERAKVYLRETGAANVNLADEKRTFFGNNQEYGLSDADQFFKLENSPNDLYNLMEKITTVPL